MKIVCVFAIHRTGTNYLGSVLRQWPALAAFGEIFHPLQGYGLQPAHLRALAGAAGTGFTDARSPDFVRWMRAHPLEAVAALGKVAARKGKAGLYFKVFVGHWAQPPEAVIPALARLPGFTPVVLQRRCLDVYVSYRKAEAAGTYKHVDTTAVPVTLDADAYEQWAATARSWYQAVSRSLDTAGVPVLRACYERDIDLPPPALSAHWAHRLGIAPGAGPLAANTLQRQDRSERPEDKVANFADFRAALQARGLWAETQGLFLPEA